MSYNSEQNNTLNVEQITEADLLAVTLFENRGEDTNQKALPACAGGLVPPLDSPDL